MNEKDLSGRECNDSECANEMSGLWGRSQDHGHTYKTRLCAHQPVPWKEMNAERGAEESFLPDGQRHIYSRERLGIWGRKTMTYHLHDMATS
jgi:hypothetical protein